MPGMQQTVEAGPGERQVPGHEPPPGWQHASDDQLEGLERMLCGQPQLPSAAVPFPPPSLPVLFSPCIPADSRRMTNVAAVMQASQRQQH